MVVGVRDAAGLVLDHEHRQEVRLEALVHEHLHGDAAVGEEGRRHAGGHGGLADGASLLQPVHVHLPLVEAEEMPAARVADVERARAVAERDLSREEGVGGLLVLVTRTGREHVEPAARPRAAVAPSVRDAERDQPALLRRELEGLAAHGELRSALQDVEGLLVRVHVPAEVPLGGDLAGAEAHVDRAGRPVDERLPTEAEAPTAVGIGGGHGRGIQSADVMHGGSSRRRHGGQQPGHPAATVPGVPYMQRGPRVSSRGSGCRRAPNPPCRTEAARYTLAPPDLASGKENDGIARECGALTVEFIVNRIQEGRS